MQDDDVSAGPSGPKRFRHGVVAGRFLPYHRGHRYLIATALAQCERVSVLVCTRAGQPIPADVRADWIRQSLPAADVRIVDQDALDLADDDGARWAEVTVALLGEAPDAVFTSEGFEAWSAALGATRVLVDPEREHVPVSGTQIRNAPRRNLGFLEPQVARWFEPALVCVLGAESTGKTTLARDLAEALGAPWLPEYGRIYTEALADPERHVWTVRDFVVIAERQDALEDAALATADADVVVCDTSSFVTAIFCEEYLGQRSPLVDDLAARRRYDLFLVTDPDTPFARDGTGLREAGARRRRMHAAYLAYAEASGTPTVLVTGGREERLAQALAAVREHLGVGSPAAEPRPRAERDALDAIESA